MIGAVFSIILLLITLVVAKVVRDKTSNEYLRIKVWMISGFFPCLTILMLIITFIAEMYSEEPISGPAVQGGLVLFPAAFIMILNWIFSYFFVAKTFYQDNKQ